jgi:hypothetical protein
MVKKISSRAYDSIRYKDFLKVASNFAEGAELAYEFEYYNAAGVLYIHSSIAYSDAITIKLSGRKCKGENHYEVIQLLEQVIPQIRIDKRAINNFKSLIDHKNLISYSGDIYHKNDMEKIRKYFKRFREWAESILE